MPNSTQVAGVSVDGDQLAAALRRVSPFAAESGQENLVAVYAESDGTNLQLTACDGFRLAHLTVCLPFPQGNYLMKLAGVKDFAFRHFNGAQVQVEPDQADPPGFINLGEVRCEVVATPYIDYPATIPDTFPVEAIIETKKWIKAIRSHKSDMVGVVYSPDGCKMFSQTDLGEPLGCDELPVQMYSGPEMKVAYKSEHLRRALTSCGPNATIQVSDPLKPTLFESADYWHILMPNQGFPKEVVITKPMRDALDLLDEAIKSVRSGDVAGYLLIGGGKFYLEIGTHVKTTQVNLKEPVLDPGAIHDVDFPETGESEDVEAPVTGQAAEDADINQSLETKEDADDESATTVP
jgi:hypothetical protein